MDSHAIHLAQVPAIPIWSRQFVPHDWHSWFICIFVLGWFVPVLESKEVAGFSHDIEDSADITLAEMPA